ncbi:hypothetical protein ES703_06510 [subsurface metagenome]
MQLAFVARQAKPKISSKLLNHFEEADSKKWMRVLI